MMPNQSLQGTANPLRSFVRGRAWSLGGITGTLDHTQVQTNSRYAHLSRDSIHTAAAQITESIRRGSHPLSMLDDRRARRTTALPRQSRPPTTRVLDTSK